MIRCVAVVALASVVLLPLAAMPAAGQECSCGELALGEASARELLDDSDALVVGRVESSFSTSDSDVVRSRVSVELIYKGDVGRLIDVQSHLGDGDCGFPSIADSGAHLIALEAEQAGYSTGACRFLPVNYYGPSQTVASPEYGELLSALSRLAPPHAPVVPTPLPDGGDDIADDDDGGPSSRTVAIVAAALGLLATGFALGRITASRG